MTRLGARLTVAAVTLIAPVAVLAQEPTPSAARRWTIEIYAGGVQESRSSGGTPIAQLPQGNVFTMESGRPSRAHASWRFGDGALLFNQVAAQFSQITGQTFATITPIDDILRTGISNSGTKGMIGARLGRLLTPTVALELSIERGAGSLTPSDATIAALTAANDSFTAAFQQLLGTAPISGLVVTSGLGLPSGAHTQTRIIGSVSKTLARGSRWSAAGTLGGGVQLRGGTAAQVSMNGNYQFNLFSASPFSERDEIHISFEEPSSVMLGLVGLSATYDVNATTGLRLGARAHLASNRATTSIQTKPFVNVAGTPATLPTATTPGVQFTNQASSVSSLTPSLGSTFTTFTGSGLTRQFIVTLGLVRRF
jgi:hypothetical protein